MKTKVYDSTGKIKEEIDLKKEIFGLPINETVVYDAVRAQMANNRSAVAHTKTRSDVRGGGKKPWRQKGTGRARQGSIRAPQWVGGGIVFGPTNERNFSLKINKKTKKKAVCIALSDKFAHDKIIILDELQSKEYKTKEIASILKNLPCSGKKVLVALPGKVSNVVRAVRNVRSTHITNAQSLNIVDVLKYEYIVLTTPAVAEVEKTYAY